MSGRDHDSWTERRRRGARQNLLREWMINGRRQPRGPKAGSSVSADPPKGVITNRKCRPPTYRAALQCGAALLPTFTRDMRTQPETPCWDPGSGRLYKERMTFAYGTLQCSG